MSDCRHLKPGPFEFSEVSMWKSLHKIGISRGMVSSALFKTYIAGLKKQWDAYPLYIHTPRAAFHTRWKLILTVSVVRCRAPYQRLSESAILSSSLCICKQQEKKDGEWDASVHPRRKENKPGDAIRKSFLYVFRSLVANERTVCCQKFFNPYSFKLQSLEQFWHSPLCCPQIDLIAQKQLLRPNLCGGKCDWGWTK